MVSFQLSGKRERRMRRLRLVLEFGGGRAKILWNSDSVRKPTSCPTQTVIFPFSRNAYPWQTLVIFAFLGGQEK
jgi:hypothetical protein